MPNQIRGLLTEYGIVLPQGMATLRRRLPELLEDTDNGLSDLFRRLLAQSYQQLVEIDAHMTHSPMKFRNKRHTVNPASAWSVFPASVRLWPVCSKASSAMALASAGDETHRLHWAWFHASIVAVVRAGCWGLANAGTGICVACCVTARDRWSSRRQKRTTH